jgi:hypothetical protein
MTASSDAIISNLLEQIKPVFLPIIILYILQNEGKKTSNEIHQSLEEFAQRPINLSLKELQNLLDKLIEYKVIKGTQIGEGGLLKSLISPLGYSFDLTDFGIEVVEKIDSEIILLIRKLNIKTT